MRLPLQVLGAGLLAASVVGVASDPTLAGECNQDRAGVGRWVALADFSRWTGWTTAAGVALLFVGSRGARR